MDISDIMGTNLKNAFTLDIMKDKLEKYNMDLKRDVIDFYEEKENPEITDIIKSINNK